MWIDYGDSDILLTDPIDTLLQYSIIELLMMRSEELTLGLHSSSMITCIFGGLWDDILVAVLGFQLFRFSFCMWKILKSLLELRLLVWDLMDCFLNKLRLFLEKTVALWDSLLKSLTGLSVVSPNPSNFWYEFLLKWLLILWWVICLWKGFFSEVWEIESGDALFS